MPTSYPGALDDSTDLPSAAALTGEPLDNPDHATISGTAHEAIIAIETELGTDPSGSEATVKDRIAAAETGLSNHLSDSADAHDASAISILDAANDFTATDVEGALAELQSDHETDAQNLSDHAADTTSIHGIADTSALETTTGAQTKVDTHVNDSSAAHAASAISFTPAGSIAATDVQAAIEEVASEAGDLSAHLSDTSDAHDASAISILDTAGDFTATDVEGALAELQSEKQPLDSDLTTIGGLSPSNDDIIQRKSGAWTNRTLAQLASDLGISTVLTAIAGISVPRRAFDRFRGGMPRRSYLYTALSDTTGTTVVPNSTNLTRSGVKEVIRIDDEEMFVTGGQGTLSLTVVRGVNGTTAATHSAGAAILTSRVQHVVLIGDSTAQGTTSSADTSDSKEDSWDSAANRLRRTLSARFGGSLGPGFFPMYRSGGSTVGGVTNGNTASEWTLDGGTWSIGTSLNNWDLGPWWIAYSADGGTATWTRPPGAAVAQIDVHWADVSGISNAWSYSLDGGTTWIDNPLTPAGPATAQLRKSRIVIDTRNPITSFKVRAKDSGGTNRASMLVGVNVWSTVEEFGVTEGVMFHNLGKDGDTLAQLMRARSFGDLTTTASSTTATSNEAAFTTFDTGKILYGPNLPAAGVAVTYVSATQVTLASSSGVSTGTAHGTLQGTLGDWAAIFEGHPGSLVPDLILMGPWTNDMAINLGTVVGSRTVTGTITNTTDLEITSGTLYSTDSGKVVYNATNIPAGTTITYVDSTHATLSGACTNAAGISIVVCATEDTINKGIAYRHTIFRNEVNAFADMLSTITFEQGGVRLTGAQSTAAKQLSYRTALEDWCDANLVAYLNVFEAWTAQGIADYAAAAADGLVDTSDTSGFHYGAVGHRDLASRWSRILETY